MVLGHTDQSYDDGIVIRLEARLLDDSCCDSQCNPNSCDNQQGGNTDIVPESLILPKVEVAWSWTEDGCYGNLLSHRKLYLSFPSVFDFLEPMDCPEYLAKGKDQ